MFGWNTRHVCLGDAGGLKVDCYLAWQISRYVSWLGNPCKIFWDPLFCECHGSMELAKGVLLWMWFCGFKVTVSLHIWILLVSFNIDRGDNRWVCVGMDSVSEHTAMICCMEINRKWLLLFCHLWRAHQFQWSTVQCNPQLCHHSKHCIYQVRKRMKEKWAKNITLSFIFSSATQSKLWV